MEGFYWNDSGTRHVALLFLFWNECDITFLYFPLSQRMLLFRKTTNNCVPDNLRQFLLDLVATFNWWMNYHLHTSKRRSFGRHPSERHELSGPNNRNTFHTTGAPTLCVILKVSFLNRKICPSFDLVPSGNAHRWTPSYNHCIPALNVITWLQKSAISLCFQCRFLSLDSHT